MEKLKAAFAVFKAGSALKGAGHLQASNLLILINALIVFVGVWFGVDINIPGEVLDELAKVLVSVLALGAWFYNTAANDKVGLLTKRKPDRNEDANDGDVGTD